MKQTYKEFIQNIINIRGQWCIPEGKYYEAHHIIPICLGGLPNKRHCRDKYLKHPNLIWLTAKEHYIAHKLLAEENPEVYDIVFTFRVMSGKTKLGHNSGEVVIKNEDDYARAKELLQTLHYKKRWYTDGNEEIRSEICPEGWLPGRCNRIIEGIKREVHVGHKGALNPMYGKHWTEEQKQRLSDISSSHYWWNNGIEEVLSSECPGENFKEGRLSRKWFTDGINDTLAFNCPEGWKPGRCGKHALTRYHSKGKPLTKHQKRKILTEHYKANRNK